MSVSAMYTLQAFTCGGGMIDQITDTNIDPKVEEVIQSGNGDVDARFVAMMKAEPLVGFTTTAIATAMGISGISGYKVAAAADLYLQALDNQGTRASGGHIKVTCSKGILVPKTLKASTGKAATIEYDLYAISSDGTTTPMVIASGQNLSLTPTVDELYTVGPLTVNGTAYGGVQDITVDFGIKVECRVGDGQPYPTFCAIMERRPSIKVKVLDAAKLATLTTPGIAISGTTSVAFLGLADGGVRSGSNKTVSVAKGRVTCSGLSGSDGNEQSLEVHITPAFDGTNDVLAIS